MPTASSAEGIVMIGYEESKTRIDEKEKKSTAWLVRGVVGRKEGKLTRLILEGE